MAYICIIKYNKRVKKMNDNILEVKLTSVKHSKI